MHSQIIGNHNCTPFATSGRHGDPGAAEWPSGAVSGARLRLRRAAQRHFAKETMLRLPNPGLKSRPTSIFSIFLVKWSFQGCVWNVFMEHGRSPENRKSHFYIFLRPLVVTGTPGLPNGPRAQFQVPVCDFEERPKGILRRTQRLRAAIRRLGFYPPAFF